MFKRFWMHCFNYSRDTIGTIKNKDLLLHSFVYKTFCLHGACHSQILLKDNTRYITNKRSRGDVSSYLLRTIVHDHSRDFSSKNCILDSRRFSTEIAVIVNNSPSILRIQQVELCILTRSYITLYQ